MSGNFAIKGGGGRLMANAILNFHFDFLNPSLTWAMEDDLCWVWTENLVWKWDYSEAISELVHSVVDSGPSQGKKKEDDHHDGGGCHHAQAGLSVNHLVDAARMSSLETVYVHEDSRQIFVCVH